MDLNLEIIWFRPDTKFIDLVDHQNYFFKNSSITNKKSFNFFI